MRHIRRDYNELFKEGEKNGDISEDDCRRMLEKVQDLDRHLHGREGRLRVSKKEAEVLEV
jgi:ribosome recycling factor